MRGKTQGKETSSISKLSQEYKIVLEAMKEESRRLKSEIDQETRNSLSGPESYIARLQDQLDVYSRKIKQEEQKLIKVDLDILQTQTEMKEKRKTINHYKEKKSESNSDIFAIVNKTEHKLDKTLQQYNQAVAENKKLRDEIDKLRRQKIVFRTLYDGLGEELATVESGISDIAKQRERNLKLREEAMRKLVELQREKEICKARLETLIEDLPKYEKKLEKEFRIQQVLEGDEELLFDSNSLMIDTSITTTKEVRFSKSLKKQPEPIDEIENEKRQEWVKKMDELVKQFGESENENNSLFNHVDDMTSEIEKLEKIISNVKQEIEDYKLQGIQTEEQKKRIMSELEVRISHTEARAEAYEKKHNKMMTTVLSLKPGIDGLLSKIGLNSNPLNESTSSDKDFDIGSIVEYFNLIEVRTSEIMQIYNYLKNPKNLTSPFEKFGPSQKVEDKKKEARRYDIDLLPVISDSPGLDDEANLPLPANVFFDKCIEKEGEILKKK